MVFDGFPKGATRHLSALCKNNSEVWLDARRTERDGRFVQSTKALGDSGSPGRP